jgi:hypothetical protein
MGSGGLNKVTVGYLWAIVPINNKGYTFVMDFLEQTTPTPIKDNNTDPVVDFLSNNRVDGLDDYMCDRTQGGCGHGLTAHTRGMILHDRCLIVGCDCKKAVLTENAKRRCAKYR